MLKCGASVLSPSCDAGGTHVPRYEDFNRYRFFGDQSGWEVTHKDGRRWLFNQPQTSPNGTIVKWLLGETLDTDGNSVKYTYSNDDWLYFCPSTVSYNGTTISFHYESRPDPVTAASGVSLLRINRRLKTVAVWMSGGKSVGDENAKEVVIGSDSVVRAYALSYTANAAGVSLLSSIQMYGRGASIADDGSVSGTALPKTYFRWNATDPASGSPAGYQTVTAFSGFDALGGSNVGQWFADLNGDGTADFVKMNWEDGVLRWNHANRDGSWGQRQTQGGMPVPGRPGSDIRTETRSAPQPIRCATTAPGSRSRFRA